MERRVFITTAAALCAMPAFAQSAARKGQFSGLNRKKASGHVIVENGEIKIQGDFMFSGAPDTKVAFGNNGAYDPSTIIAPLVSDEGASSYKIPSNINPDAYNEVHLWCEFFSVGLAVAPLK